MHPKAHYLSPRTNEILQEIGVFARLKEATKHNSIDNWRHYRYCSSILDPKSYMGEIDHFEDKTQYLNYINQLSNSEPMHIGQNILNEELLDEVLKAKNIQYLTNSEVKSFKIKNDIVK